MGSSASAALVQVSVVMLHDKVVHSLDPPLIHRNVDDTFYVAESFPTEDAVVPNDASALYKS